MKNVNEKFLIKDYQNNLYYAGQGNFYAFGTAIFYDSYGDAQNSLRFIQNGYYQIEKVFVVSKGTGVNG